MQVEDFGNAIAEKDMVATFDALLEPSRFRSCTMPEKGIFASAPPLRIWSRRLFARAMAGWVRKRTARPRRLASLAKVPAMDLLRGRHL